MLASFLGVLPILTPPLCALAFIMDCVFLLDFLFVEKGFVLVVELGWSLFGAPRKEGIG
jgi:hypothetical protein